MYQFAIMMSQPRHVMLLDCRTREYKLVDANLPGCTWILINTRVKHALIDSDYNQRAAQCKQAVEKIKETFPDVRALRDVDIDMLKASHLSDTLLKRSAFVIDPMIDSTIFSCASASCGSTCLATVPNCPGSIPNTCPRGPIFLTALSCLAKSSSVNLPVSMRSASSTSRSSE